MSFQNNSPAGESRRSFLKRTALGAAGLAVVGSARSHAAVPGANNKVRAAIIGLKRRGLPLLGSFSKVPNVEVTWLCEVDSRQMEIGLEKAQEFLGYQPKTDTDMRRIVEQPDVDAVFIATPDHWHAYGTLIALQNGKHVYLEKPTSHNLAEDALLIQAEKAFPQLKIQVGTQQRSSVESNEIISEIHNGVIGNPYKAVAFYTNNRSRVPVPQVVPVPGFLDWELWQGPAPRRAFLDILEDYNWHWRWHWGTAESANNGTHELDVGRWALQGIFPERVQTESGKFHFVDDGWEMYDTMTATFRYPGNKLLQWECSSRNGYLTYGEGRGTLIHGTEGSVFLTRESYKLYNREGELLRERRGAEEAGVALGGGGSLTDRHVLNFVESIRGKVELTAPLSEGAVSTQLTHYVNVASQAGDARLEIDPATGKFRDWAIMDRFWGRAYEPGWEPKL